MCKEANSLFGKEEIQIAESGLNSLRIQENTNKIIIKCYLFLSDVQKFK